MTDVFLQSRVEEYVKEHKILKKDFAKRIGVSPVRLSHWLNGRILFNSIILEKICDEIGNAKSSNCV